MANAYTNSYRNRNLKCSPCLLSIYSLILQYCTSKLLFGFFMSLLYEMDFLQSHKVHSRIESKVWHKQKYIRLRQTLDKKTLLSTTKKEHSVEIQPDIVYTAHNQNMKWIIFCWPPMPLYGLWSVAQFLVLETELQTWGFLDKVQKYPQPVKQEFSLANHTA